MSDLLAMQRAVWLSKRTSVEKMVLLAIMDFYSAKSPEPWPSTSTLAQRTSFGRTSIHRALSALERDGVLGVRRVFGQSNRYDLSNVCLALAFDRYNHRLAKPRRAGVPEQQTLAPWAAPDLERGHAPPEQSGKRTASQTSDTPPSSGVQPAAKPSGDVPRCELAPAVRVEVTACTPCRELPRPCSTATAPVCVADGSAERSPGEQHLFACGTPPVPQANTKEPINEPKKEPTPAPPTRTTEARDAQRRREGVDSVPARQRGAAMQCKPAGDVQSLIVRAKVALADGAAAVGVRPEEWPEAKQAAEAFSRATGEPRRLGDLARDAGLRALLTLYAQGYAAEDVAWVAGTVPRQRWWQEGRHALASLSPRVVARALEERRREAAERNANRAKALPRALGRDPPLTESLARDHGALRPRSEPPPVNARQGLAAEALAEVLSRIYGDAAPNGPGVRSAAPRQQAEPEQTACQWKVAQ